MGHGSMGALAFALKAVEVGTGDEVAGDGSATQARQMMNLQIVQCHAAAPLFSECPPFQQVEGLLKTSMVQKPEQTSTEHRGGTGAVLREFKQGKQLCEHP